jgi:hypothetical protein
VHQKGRNIKIRFSFQLEAYNNYGKFQVPNTILIIKILKKFSIGLLHLQLRLPMRIPLSISSARFRRVIYTFLFLD